VKYPISSVLELRSSPFMKINGDCHYESFRHKKEVVGPIIKWVPPSLIIVKIFCVLISPNGRNGEEIKRRGS